MEHGRAYGDQLLASIAVAHAAGVVHNDLHDHNLAIVREKVFIIDWADATCGTTGEAGLDEVATLKDLVSYTSADIYGLTCTPYPWLELLTKLEARPEVHEGPACRELQLTLGPASM